MNKITELFLDHLKHRRAAGEAISTWIYELDQCNEAPGGTKVAIIELMAAMHQELLVFMGSVDLATATLRFQD